MNLPQITKRTLNILSEFQFSFSYTYKFVDYLSKLFTKYIFNLKIKKSWNPYFALKKTFIILFVFILKKTERLIKNVLLKKLIPEYY